MKHNEITSKQLLSLLSNAQFQNNEAIVNGYKIIIDGTRIKVYNKSLKQEFYVSEIIYFDGDEL